MLDRIEQLFLEMPPERAKEYIKVAFKQGVKDNSFLSVFKAYVESRAIGKDGYSSISLTGFRDYCLNNKKNFR